MNLQQSSDRVLLGQSPQQLIDSLPDRVSMPVFRWAETSPQAVAVRDQQGQVCTYQELAAAVRQMQTQLQQQGVRRGDRVMLVNENCVALVILILALSELEAWPVIVNARMAESELRRIREHCEPRLVLYTLGSAAARQHWQKCSELAHACELDCTGTALGCELFDSACPDEDPAQGADRLFTIIYTTGTTGPPKGVMLSHRNILYVAAVSSALRGMKSSDRIYCVLPISHVFGLAAVMLASLYVGAELVMADRFDADETLRTLHEAGITGLFGVPTLFARLADHARIQGLEASQFPSLRFMYSGGAPLDPSIKHKVENLFGLPLLNAYGMTESGPTICQVRYNEPLQSCSVGRPLPGLKIKVLDSHGQPVRRGEVGELHVKGPNIMRGYYRNPEASAVALNSEAYLNTGDLVYQDDHDNVFIAGRSKELIIHSGFNVYPPEVEAVISQHPQVLICAVVGRMNGEGNEEVVAYVQQVPDGQLDEVALQTFIRPQLAAYKRPSHIVFAEQLPTAPSGKVLKHKLEVKRSPT